MPEYSAHLPTKTFPMLISCSCLLSHLTLSPLRIRGILFFLSIPRIQHNIFNTNRQIPINMHEIECMKKQIIDSPEEDGHTSDRNGRSRENWGCVTRNLWFSSTYTSEGTPGRSTVSGGDREQGWRQLQLISWSSLTTTKTQDHWPSSFYRWGRWISEKSHNCPSLKGRDSH